MRPNIDIALMNGGLGLIGPPSFGTCGLLIASPVAPVAGYGVPFLVKNKKQVETAFAQAGNAVVKTDITTYFFGEAAEGTSLYIMCMAATTKLTDLLKAENADKLLTLANGAVRVLGSIKYPANTYVPVIATGFDTDVNTAVPMAQQLCDAWFINKKPFRVLVQSFAFSTPAAALDYETAAYRNVGIVVGEINGSTAQSLLLALGRASKVPPQRNIGRVFDGSLNIAAAAPVTIGGVAIENVPVSDLEILHAKRYISFERNEIASGYIFSDDNMLTSIADDFNNLAYGRVIDNAVRISFITYYRSLKDEVDVTEGGRLNTITEKALENAVENDIDLNMRTQLSKKQDGTADAECLINPDAIAYAPLYQANGIENPNFNLLQTGKLYIFLKLRPKGFLKHLYVYLGYTS